MAIPAWYWPPSGAAARGFTLSTFATGLAVGDWTSPQIWPFASGAFSPAIPMPGTPYGTPGIAALTQAVSGGVWALSHSGQVWNVLANHAIGAMYSLPTGTVYGGMTLLGGNAVPYVLDSSGNVLAASGTAIGVFGARGLSLAGSGLTVMSIIPSLAGVGTMTTAGVTGLISFPATIASASCIAVPQGGSPALGIGGWVLARNLSGAAAAAMNPADNTRVLAVGTGRALLWTAQRGVSGDSWAQTQLVTGANTLNSVVWTPDGTQALATSLISGDVQVFNYSAGTVSLAQTLALSGAIAVATAGNSAHALVAQSTLSQATTISATAGTWATGTTFTELAGIVAAVAYGPSNVAIAYTNNLALFAIDGGGNWSRAGTVALGFTPAAITANSFGQIYAATSGSLAVVSGTAIIGTGTVTVTPTSLALQSGRLLVASSGQIQIFGTAYPGFWSQQSSAAVGLGATIGMGLSQTTLFALGSTATTVFGFSGTPYVLTPVLSGNVAQWDGASWTTTPLGVGYTPSAVFYDPTTALWVTTTQNDLWSMAGSGTVLTTGVVTSYQAATVPLGAAVMDINPSDGTLYVGTSLPGVLIAVASGFSFPSGSPAIWNGFLWNDGSLWG